MIGRSQAPAACNTRVWHPAVILAGSMLLFAIGCQAPPQDHPTTTWSEDVKSPDGKWVAMARSEVGGAWVFSSYDVTIVSLKRADEEPIRILGFSHQYATMNLKMAWSGPRHLNVTYGPGSRADDHVDLNFQAVKCAGVEITVQNLESATTNPSP